MVQVAHTMQTQTKIRGAYYAQIDAHRQITPLTEQQYYTVYSKLN